MSNIDLGAKGSGIHAKSLFTHASIPERLCADVVSLNEGAIAAGLLSDRTSSDQPKDADAACFDKNGLRHLPHH